MSNYVDNTQLVQALVEYKARKELNPEERLPEYVGYCVLEIAKRFSTRPNFYGYSYRNEMISDAVENVIRYIGNFDVSKSTNAFSYITQITYYAFLRRIAREKKESYIKHRLIQDMPLETFAQYDNEDAEVSQNFHSFITANSNFEHTAYEKSMAAKKKGSAKHKLTPLELFMEEDVEALFPAEAEE